MTRAAIIAFLAALTVVLCTGRALAGDPLPGAGSVAESESASHGWIVMQSDSASPWMLLHVTPRRPDGAQAAGEALVPEAVSGPGQARFAGPLESIPLALAAVSNDLYLVFDTDTPGANGFRRIFRVRAERDSVSGVWRTLPLGRLEHVTVQPVEGELLAFVGTPKGPCAVIRSGATTSVWLLVDDQWREVVLAPGMLAAFENGEFRGACAGREGLELLLDPAGVGPWELWRAELRWPTRSASAPPEESFSTLWDSPRAPLPLDWTFDRLPSLQLPGVEDTWLLRVGGELAFAFWRSADGLTVVRTDGGAGWVPCASAPDAPQRCAVLGLTSAGRVFAAWSDTTGENGDSHRHGWEVRLADGEVLHDGALKLSGPVSRTDYRLLMMVVLVITVSTLAFVLKPEDRAAFHLPYGFSLPGTMRRTFAGGLDAALSLSVSHVCLRLASEDLAVLDPARLNTLDLISGALACAFVMGLVSEALVGRTPGKLFLGLQVITVVPDAAGELWAERPSFGRVLVRNLLKWTAFPLALVGLLSSEGRGRPDQLAGTVVVVRDEDDADDEPE